MYARYQDTPFTKRQPLATHLLAVAEEMRETGEWLQLPHTVWIIGVLHDIGKARKVWQEYLFSQTGTMEHAIWGAAYLTSIMPNPDTLESLWLKACQNILLSHHGVLKNTYENEAYEQKLAEAQTNQAALEEMTAFLKSEPYEEHTLYAELMHRLTCIRSEFEAVFRQTTGSFELPMIIYSLFSALINADWTDAANWYRKDTRDFKKLNTRRIQELEDRLAAYMRGFTQQTKINQLRAEISDAVCAAGDKLPGIYSLSTPVGAGKTISSLRYALNHAKKYKKERIIYVLPFTAIIEQNAQEIRKYLQADEWLLEHHSQVILDAYSPQTKFHLEKARDDWNAPIIVTTMYQYLMAFYGGKGRSVRRMQNLMNSVVIFDEVQSVPTKSTILFNQTVRFLSTFGQSTLLLCTATQPTLDTLNMKHRSGDVLSQPKYANIPVITPLLSKEYALDFKRVDFIYDRSISNTASIVTHMQKRETKSTLFILNTKTVVLQLYEALRKVYTDIPIYHLSTDMCPKHRTTILNSVRAHLDKDELVLCVSTPLIEAGVDISFPVVYRSLSKLDSIAQASGRCNRHGRWDTGIMYLFYHQEEQLEMLVEVAIGRSVTQSLVDRWHKGIGGLHPYLIHPENIKRYYEEYFEKRAINHELVYPTRPGKNLYTQLFNIKDIQHYRQRNLPYAFGTVAAEYKVYDDDQVGVLVPYKEGAQLIQAIRTGGPLSDNWLKEAQQFSVNVYQNKLEKLLGTVIEAVEIAPNQSVYIALAYTESGLNLSI